MMGSAPLKLEEDSPELALSAREDTAGAREAGPRRELTQFSDAQPPET